jgi:hypothetical protein
MIKDRANRFRRLHLDFLAVAFADQDSIFVGNFELDTYKSFGQ